MRPNDDCRTSVADKETGQKPLDAGGRPMINRFFGGSKAYYNLAAYIREKIGLKEKVNYGPDYGASVAFGPDGNVHEAVA